MPSFIPNGLGWRPDLPDFRDYRPVHRQVQELFQHLSEPPYLRTHVMLDEFFPHPVAEQDTQVNSAAHACVSLIEYFEYRSFGKIVEPSVRFVSRYAPRLEISSCTQCAGLRATIQTMKRLGIPPADLIDRGFDRQSPESDPVLFAFKENYCSLVYVRLDAESGQADQTLLNIKSFLNAGLPLVFGFPVPSSLTSEEQIEFRPSFDSIRGGQAAVITGFDDNRLMSTRGALRIRCTWGAQWGKNGYGWLPYTFVQSGLAKDLWSILRPEWLVSREFYRPSCVA